MADDTKKRVETEAKVRWSRDTHLSLRLVFSSRGLDALKNRKAKEYNCTHCDPLRGDMQYHGSID